MGKPLQPIQASIAILSGCFSTTLRASGRKPKKKIPKDYRRLFYPRRCDVSNKDDIKATFEWIKKSLGSTDILVNNAGVFKPAKLVDMDLKAIDEVLDTNVKGLIYCQAAIKSMRERNFDGHIIHINSVTGHKVTPANIYPPSKFAVTAINETLRNELRDLGTKIKTTSLSPGVVRTEIISKEVLDTIENCLNPEDISQAVLFAISTTPHVQIYELTVKPIGEMM